jgi:hypothetical protein
LKRVGHGSSNPHAKPVIKQFIQSPNHSCRNGARIDKIVLHCTEASLGGHDRRVPKIRWPPSLRTLRH